MTESPGRVADAGAAAGGAGGSRPPRTMRNVVVVLGIALAVLHQDWWFRADPSLVFGFIPISLFYHLCFSVSVAGLWALMSKFAWPTHIGEFAALGDAAPGNAAPAAAQSAAAPGAAPAEAAKP